MQNIPDLKLLLSLNNTDRYWQWLLWPQHLQARCDRQLKNRPYKLYYCHVHGFCSKKSPFHVKPWKIKGFQNFDLWHLVDYFIVTFITLHRHNHDESFTKQSLLPSDPVYVPALTTLTYFLFCRYVTMLNVAQKQKLVSGYFFNTISKSRSVVVLNWDN